MAENALGFVSGAGNGWLQYKLHEKEIEVATKHHVEEIDHATTWNIKAIGASNRMHQESMDITKKIYLWDTSTDLSQHFQQVTD
jgi:hypothetical protein